MSTDIDELIGAEVERSFTAEPSLRDPQEYAVRGRRAARRRTAGAAGAAAGLVAAVAVVATLLGGGTGPTASPDQVVEPAGPTTTHTMSGFPVRVVPPDVPVDPDTAEKCRAGSLGTCDRTIGWDDIHFDDSGRLLRGYSDVRVTGYYMHVLPAPFSESAAVELTVHGRTAWALLQRQGAKTSGSEMAPADPTRTFDEWVADSVGRHGAGGWFSYRKDPDAAGKEASPR